MSEIRVGSISTEEGVDTFRFVQTVTFETSGTFDPASYPWLRAVRRKIWGGGGAGGDCSVGTTTKAGAAGGGGAGGYSEDFYINPSSVATISIGAGATSTGNETVGISNPDGGTSSYVDGADDLYAYGGESGFDANGQNDLEIRPGGRGGKDNSNTDRVGSHGIHGTSLSQSGVASYSAGCSGAGGSSAIGMGGTATSLRLVTGSGESGKDAQGKAAGGGGSISLGGGYFSGGDGGDGFVELELYA